MLLPQTKLQAWKNNNSNYGLKEILYYWANTTRKKDFYCVPGVVKENFGRGEVELLVYSNRSYVWGDYLKRKLQSRENIHYGCSPFVYSHIMNDVKVKRDKNTFILPRSDSATGLGDEKEIIQHIKTLINSIDNCQVYSYPLDKKYWEDHGVDAKIISEKINDPTWQLKVDTVFRSSKQVYLPIVCSDVFYASLCGCTINFYDCLDLYTKESCPNIITNSYAKSELKNPFHIFDSLIRDIYDGQQNSSEIEYLNSKMLSLKNIQSREELNQSLSRFDSPIRVKSCFDFEMCGSMIHDFQIEVNDQNIDQYRNYSSSDEIGEIDKILELI